MTTNDSSQYIHSTIHIFFVTLNLLQKRILIRTTKWILMILLPWFFLSPALAETIPSKVNVLLLYSYHIEGKGSLNFDKGVRLAFKKDTSVSVNTFTEYMDTMRFTGDKYERKLFEYYRTKYKNIKIDIIITYASTALDFLLKYGEEIFPGSLVVSGLVSETVFKKRTFPDNYTGILSGPQFASTLDTALALLPATNKVLIVGGTSPVDKQYFSVAKTQLKPFSSRVNIEYIDQLGMEDLLIRVGHQPSDTIIICSLLQQDGKGKHFGPKNAANRIAKAANVPVFGISQTHMGSGIVGGSLNSTALVGNKSATKALQIFKEKKQMLFNTYHEETHIHLFDWHQLKRWNLDEEKLPPGSVLWGKEFTVWEQHRKLIITVAIFMIFETLLIALLLINRRKRIQTEQFLRESEKNLRETNSRHASMIANIGDVIGIMGSDGTLKYKSPNIEKWFGWKPEDLIGNDGWKNIHPEDIERLQKEFDALLEKDNTSGTLECRYQCKNGLYKWVVLTAVNCIKDTSINGILLNYHDITERRQADKMIRQAQKMESIGTLAGGIAHDFNNILFPIIGFTELSIDELPENHPVIENLEDVLKGAKRASKLVRQILLFSRQRETKYHSILIQPIIKEALKLLRSTIPANIKMQHDLYKDSKCIFGDATEVFEIIMNLCTNAYHAMEETGGTMKVSLYEKNPDPKLKLPPGEYCCLSVNDNGAGIPANVIDSLFEPYFTTKELGKGTGLGLSVVHGIVKNYKGTILVESAPNKGTTFYIYLPLISDTTTINLMPTTDKKEIGGNENILFVDDEKAIVKLGTQLLKKSGYNVTGKTDPIEALALFKSHPDEFDLVITDMSMPDMVGTEFAKRLMAVRSDIPIIICTGFSEKLNHKTAMSIGIQDYLQKPIIMDNLFAKVRKVLDHAKKR